MRTLSQLVRRDKKRERAHMEWAREVRGVSGEALLKSRGSLLVEVV